MLAAMTMLEIDRHFDGVFFDSRRERRADLLAAPGWIFFNGAWVMVMLPAAGAISEILPTLSGKPPFSRRTVAVAMAAIGVLGLLAWMQNMYTAAVPDGFLFFAQLMALA